MADPVTPAIVGLITASVVGGVKVLEVAGNAFMARRKNGPATVDLAELKTEIVKLRESQTTDSRETAAALAGLKQQVKGLEERVDRIGT